MHKTKIVLIIFFHRHGHSDIFPTFANPSPGSLMVHPLSMRSTLLPLPIFLLDPSKTILFQSDHLKLDSLPELFSLIIDREAREIIRLVASVRPSVRPTLIFGIQSKISVCLSVIRKHSLSRAALAVEGF